MPQFMVKFDESVRKLLTPAGKAKLEQEFYYTLKEHPKVILALSPLPLNEMIGQTATIRAYLGRYLQRSWRLESLPFVPEVLILAKHDPLEPYVPVQTFTNWILQHISQRIEPWEQTQTKG